MKTRNALLLARLSSLIPVGIFMMVAAVLVVPFYSVRSSSSPMPQAGTSIATFDSTCATATTEFNLNQTVCATATATGGSAARRRISWVDPSGFIRQVIPITSDTQNDPFSIPATPTSTLSNGQEVNNIGNWRVNIISSRGSLVATAGFVVKDPNNATADLSVAKRAPTNSEQVSAGSNGSFNITVQNSGPDDAQTVVLTDHVPDNTAFVAPMIQTSGPGFTCTSTPDGSGNITCTIASLLNGASATFNFVYTVNSGTPAGTLITNTASISSATNELNGADNSASASATVVGSTSGCTLTCPSVVPVETAGCNAMVTYLVPTPPGSCGAVVCSPPSGSTFPIGSTTVTCTAQSGDTCNFAVTVNFTGTSSAPTISCPSTVTAAAVEAGTATVNYPAPTTTGNCVTVVCSPPSGSVFSTGNTTVHCTATNPNSTVSCNFTVTITSTACALDCPDDKTVNESSPGSGSAVVTYAAATPVGPCPSPLTVTCNPPSGSSFPVGQTSVNCTGKNVSDVVVATCSFTVRVNSSSTCAITCPANINQPANTTCPSGNPPPNDFTPCGTVTYALPTKSGTCSPDPVVCAPPSGFSFGVGTTTVHCSATDPAGNTSSCSFTVTITGGTPCTISCPSVPSQASDSGGCTKVVTYANPTTTGSCGDPNDPLDPNPWSCSPPSGSIFPVGTTAVTCVTDVGTQCSFNVTITGTDAVAPVINSCAAPTFDLADSNCQAPVPNVTSDVDATDNCTPANLLTITQNPLPGTLVGIGTTTITLTVKDANNNSSTPCTTTFTVFDLTPPTALCKPFTVALNATGNASITAANVDNGSSDNCGIASRTVNPSAFTCANKGANTVILTVTDTSGNSASCQATVTVVDNTPPTISCPANVVQSTDPNLCTAVVTYSTTATDNCPNVGTPACSPASGSIFSKGTTTVNCTVSDASSNSASCSFTVTVNDTQLPAISCPANITVEPTCPAGAKVTYTAPVGTDNCIGSVTTQTAGLGSLSIFPIGVTTTNTFKVTDTSGNFVTCSFTVRVKTAAEVIQDLINRVQALQPPLSGQQSQGLVAKLQAALDAVNQSKTNVACNKLADFINQVQVYIGNGTLTSAQGQPLINSANNVRNALGCTNLPCS